MTLTAIQRQRGTQQAATRGQSLEQLHDESLKKTVRVTNEELKRLKQMDALKEEKQSTRLVARAFQKGGVYDEEKKRARIGRCNLLVTEHAGIKKRTLQEQADQANRAREQINLDLESLNKNLSIYNELYLRKQMELLEGKEVSLELSNIGRSRQEIRDQITEQRKALSQVSIRCQEQTERIMNASCQVDIDAIYAAYDKEKSEFDDALQITHDEEDRDAANLEKEFQRGLSLVSARTDQSCKFLSHISSEIANTNQKAIEERKQALEERKQVAEEQEKAFNARLDFVKLELEYRSSLKADAKEKKEQQLEFLRFEEETLQNRSRLALDWEISRNAQKELAPTPAYEEKKTLESKSDSQADPKNTKGKSIREEYADYLISKGWQ